MSSGQGEIHVYDRRSGQVVREAVLGDRLLRLAYRPGLHPLVSRVLFHRPWASRLLGWYCDTALSRRKIQRTIEQLGIDPAEFRDPVGSFRTFNDFFCRHLKAGARPWDAAPQVLCSPADSRVLAFPELADGVWLPVKGQEFTVQDLLRPPHPGMADGFVGGSGVIARLCPADYHRFHFPAAGRVLQAWTISGRYESVNPVALALGLPVFTENWRRVTLLQLEHFGKAAFIEVGAFGVAAVEQTHRGETFNKMQEKGTFRFGGSTIVLLFEKGRVAFEPDVLEQTGRGIETRLLAGEALGRVHAPES